MTLTRDPRPYLQDIQDSIVRIERFADGVTLRDFLGDDLLQDAIVRRISIIGEAVGRLPEAVQGRYPSIPWRDIKDSSDRSQYDVALGRERPLGVRRMRTSV